MSARGWLAGRAIVAAHRIALAAVVTVFVPGTGTTQETETLLGGGITSGGFGGPATAFTRIHGDFAVLVGGRGGWIVNHSFVLGGAGYGLVTPDIRTGFAVHGGRSGLRMGYGGVEVGYIGLSTRLVHPVARLLIGGGGVRYESDNGHGMPSDGFFVAEPALGLEVNVTHWLRVDGAGSYRFISGAHLPNVRGRDLSGFSGVLSLKFGRF